MECGRIFPQFFFWQFFSSNQSCQQLKSPKPQHIHEFFTPKIDNFLGIFLLYSSSTLLSCNKSLIMASMPTCNRDSWVWVPTDWRCRLGIWFSLAIVILRKHVKTARRSISNSTIRGISSDDSCCKVTAKSLRQWRLAPKTLPRRVSKLWIMA